MKRLQKNKTLRSPLRYPGGKFRLSKTIFGYIPDHKEYRELMVGGGSVFLRMLDAYPERKYWINDINSDLIAFWKTLKSKSFSLADEAESFKNRYKDNGKELFILLKNRDDWKGEFEIALRLYILNMISFSGLVDAGGYSKLSFEGRFTVASFSRIRELSNKLKNVKITNRSFESVTKKFGSDVFLYIDPPYFKQKNSKLYGIRGTYHINFNHLLLRETLNNSKFNWLLSYDDSEYIRELYTNDDFIIKSIDGHYGMNNVGKKTAPVGKELLIMNYENNRLK